MGMFSITAIPLLPAIVPAFPREMYEVEQRMYSQISIIANALGLAPVQVRMTHRYGGTPIPNNAVDPVQDSRIDHLETARTQAESTELQIRQLVEQMYSDLLWAMENREIALRDLQKVERLLESALESPTMEVSMVMSLIERSKTLSQQAVRSDILIEKAQFELSSVLRV